MTVMVYKKGDSLKTDSGMVDYLIIEDDDEIPEGYYLTAQEACEGENMSCKKKRGRPPKKK